MNESQVMFEALRTASRLLQAALDDAAQPRSQRLMQAAIELRDTVEDISGTLRMRAFERQGLAKGLGEFDRALLHAPVVLPTPRVPDEGAELRAAINAG